MKEPRDFSAASEARRPAWELLQRRPQDVVERLGVLSSELEARIEREEDLLGALAPVWQRAEPMIEALALGDAARVEALGPVLVGFGVGSTPAGDDYLMGAFYALWSRADADWLVAAAEPLANHTTRSSAAWLRAAARGEAGPAWRALIETLGAGHGREPLRRVVREVLDRGATSGAASLAGFIDLAELLFDFGGAQFITGPYARRRWPGPERSPDGTRGKG
jgi:hypothetical protein